MKVRSTNKIGNVDKFKIKFNKVLPKYNITNHKVQS